MGSYTYDEVGVKRPSFVFVCFFLSNHLEGEGNFSGELLALVVYVGKGSSFSVISFCVLRDSITVLENKYCFMYSSHVL